MPASPLLPGKDICHEERTSIAAPVCYSAAGALVGLPFIVGAWCWPILLGGILGFAVSQTTVLLSHTLQFAVLLATFTNLTQHTLYLCWSQRRSLKSSHWDRWGPGYLVAFSTMCIMVQPTYLVLRVAHKAPKLNDPLWEHARRSFTILGYALLFIGIMWATSLFQKLRALCRNSNDDGM
jgi:hypothetical protein